MNPDQRAALERLLEYVGRGFCAVQADCKMLREYLQTLPVLARIDDVIDYSERPFVITQEHAVLLSSLSVGETKETESHLFTKLSANVVSVCGRKNSSPMSVLIKPPLAKPTTKKPKPKTRKR